MSRISPSRRTVSAGCAASAPARAIVPTCVPATRTRISVAAAAAGPVGPASSVPSGEEIRTPTPATSANTAANCRSVSASRYSLKSAMHATL